MRFDVYVNREMIDITQPGDHWQSFKADGLTVEVRMHQRNPWIRTLYDQDAQTFLQLLVGRPA